MKKLLPLLFLVGTAHSATLVHQDGARQNIGGSTATIVIDSGDGWSSPDPDDLIICTADVRRATSTDPFVVDTPTGFTLQIDGDTAQSNRHSTRVWIKYPAVGDEDSITFSSASGTTALNSWEAGCDRWAVTDLEGTVDVSDIDVTNNNTATTASATLNLDPSKNTFAVITGWSGNQGQDFVDGLAIDNGLSIVRTMQDASRASAAVASGILMQDTVALNWTTSDTGDKNNIWGLAIVETETTPTLTLTGGAQQEAYGNVEATLSGALGCGDPTYCEFSTGNQVVPVGSGLVWDCPLFSEDYEPGAALDDVGFGARGYTLKLGCGAAESLTAPIELNVTQTAVQGTDEMAIGYTWTTTGDPQEPCRTFTGMETGDDLRYVFQNGSGQVGPGCQLAVDSEQGGDVDVEVSLFDETASAWTTLETTSLNTAATLTAFDCIDGGLRADCSVITNVTDGTIYWDIDEQCDLDEEAVSGENGSPVTTSLNVQTLYVLDQGPHCAYVLHETASGVSNMQVFEIDFQAPGAGDLEMCDHVGAYYPTGQCPPELTNPTVTNIAATTATLNVDTDRESEGDMYWCVAVADTRTADQIKAGTGCTDFGTQAAGANPQTVGATGLVTATSYYAHWVHTRQFEDGNVATSTQFTTL